MTRRYLTNMVNKSKYINPKNCEICGGRCCEKFWIVYPKDCDPVILSEVERFRLLNSDDKIDVQDRGNEYWVVFNYPCTMFEKGKCRIYGVSRPLLCREYPHTSKDTFCQFVEEER